MQCDLGDISIYYEIYGSGRPIVMLPGIPSDHGVTERFMEPLFTQRDGWLRIYPDLPGTGRTPSVDRLASNDQMLDAMLAFIDAVIPGQRFVLAGYSYGGYLARGVVYHRATSIDGLLLCAPAVTAPPAPAHLPPRSTLVEDPQLVAQLDPGIASLIVAQVPTVIEAVRTMQAEVGIADHTFLARLDEAGPFSFDVDRLSTTFGGPTLFLATGALAILGALPKGPNATSVPIAKVGELAENQWKVFNYPDEYAQGILINLPGHGLVAYSDVCTHLSCAVLYQGDGTLHCPCHDGLFDAKTGNAIAGPPIRPLSLI